MTEQEVRPELDKGANAQADEQTTRGTAHPHALKRIGWGIVALCGVLALVGVWSRWGEDIKQACTGGGDTGACVIEHDDPPSLEDVRFEDPTQPASGG